MNIVDVSVAYAASSKRLLLLDYDGTLVEFNKDPLAATPSPGLLTVLARLTQDPANTVVVISGRPAQTLDAWLGTVPLGFSAEHGFFLKKPGGVWQPVMPINEKWKIPVRELMRSYVKRVPGASLEEKTNALTWHWRAAADPKQADQAEKELLKKLESLGNALGLRVLRILRGNKVIEVHPAGYDKGTSAKKWVESEAFDFILAVGDDTTDEDLFRAIPSAGFTIKVGPGATAASLRLDSPQALRDFLAGLAHADKTTAHGHS